jgi:hypothetical protein
MYNYGILLWPKMDFLITIIKNIRWDLKNGVVFMFFHILASYLFDTGFWSVTTVGMSPLGTIGPRYVASLLMLSSNGAEPGAHTPQCVTRKRYKVEWCMHSSNRVPWSSVCLKWETIFEFLSIKISFLNYLVCALKWYFLCSIILHYGID